MNRSPAILLAVVAACLTNGSDSPAADSFVRPGDGVDSQFPVWGHKAGLQIGLAPTPGPRGLIRVYAPFLGQVFPRVVNYISIEPSVRGQQGRDQSELQISREHPESRGLSFWSTDTIDAPRVADPVGGVLGRQQKTLRVFIHTEPFQNGAQPVIECVFREQAPYEIEFVTHAAEGSAPMTSCVLSATMGNYGQLRDIHLKDGRVATALDLWKGDQLDAFGFFPWRTWSTNQLALDQHGTVSVPISSDAPDPAAVEYDANVARHWRYVGKKAVHYWRANRDANPVVAVNGRRNYWMSNSPVPGGPAFENFEIRVAFKPGNRLWFGVRPDDEP